MCDIPAIRDRIVPVPRELTALGGAPMVWDTGSRFVLQAPDADFGPVRTARERLAAFLTAHCGADCLCDKGFPITLELGQAPAEAANPQEGYRLTMSADGVRITGFGGTGLLYGVVSLTQLCRWDIHGCRLPALTVLDWPESAIRGIKEECRYGSNMMERQDWMELLDDLAERKLNFLGLALYGCWTVQYSGKLSEFLYLPVKGHPELQTPMEVRYFSPEENRWIDCEQLPPIFRDNLLEDIFCRARDLGIQICPIWNSYGHNTLIPRLIPGMSAKEADGVTPTEFGFCTSSQETFDLLFGIYDQIIDDYMIPYGMHTFATLLDEVRPGVGQNAGRPFEKISPFCQCARCRGKDHGQMFVDMMVRTTQHLKERGITSVIVANDMLYHEHSIPGLPQRLRAALEEAGLTDVLLLDWWSYSDVREKLKFQALDDRAALRSVVCPWTGYHNWSAVYHPLRNIQMLAEMNHRDGGEGILAYSNWDRSCGRSYDAVADYAWNCDGAGAVEDVTERYLTRHFAARLEDARRAYRLMDLITEERLPDDGDPSRRIISHFELMLYRLSFYNYTYVRPGKPYPRNFPGEAVALLLDARRDMERELLSIAAAGAQARDLLLSIAQDARCDTRQAYRMAYECENLRNTAEDFLALLRMHDLAKAGDYRAVAAMARARQNARLDQLAFCERAKEKFIVKALTMRNISIYMQCFCDIADYIESTDEPALDMTDLMPIMSRRSMRLR